MPRGADAMVMVEHTQPAGDRRDRDPPRRVARAVRVLCRIRHRARRGAAARRHGDRLARDRHAGGLRHRASVGRAQAARRGHFHRRRTGAARRAAARRPRSTTPTARSSPRRSPRTAARRSFSAPSPTTRRARSRDPRGACDDATWWCCRAARRRARATSRHRIVAPARQARHRRARRRAKARQAALPRGVRRQAGGRSCRAFRPRRCSPSTT